MCHVKYFMYICTVVSKNDNPIIYFQMKYIKKSFLPLLAAVLCFVACQIAPKAEKVSNPETEVAMPKDFLTLATERYSVRHFASTPVEQEKIDLILQAAKVAPTAINSQPQMIYVLRSEEAVAKANAFSPCMYGAPHAFLVCCNEDRACRRGDDGTYGDIDCSIVLTHILLEAANLGVGTCPVGYFDPAKAVETLGLPANMRPVLLIPFGYAADDAKPSDKHFSYRPDEELMEYL